MPLPCPTLPQMFLISRTFFQSSACKTGIWPIEAFTSLERLHNSTCLNECPVYLAAKFFAFGHWFKCREMITLSLCSHTSSCLSPRTSFSSMSCHYFKAAEVVEKSVRQHIGACFRQLEEQTIIELASVHASLTDQPSSSGKYVTEAL